MTDPPRELANCHPLGRERRLYLNNDLLRSEVFRDLAWAEAAVEWREAMQEGVNIPVQTFSFLLRTSL